MMSNLIFWGQPHLRKAQNILEIGPTTHSLLLAVAIKHLMVSVVKGFLKRDLLNSPQTLSL